MIKMPMFNKKTCLMLLVAVGCGHHNQRQPSSVGIDGPVVDYKTHIRIPKSTEENKDIRDRLQVNEGYGYWESSVTPSGFVVPRIQIQKSEGLKCFMTNQASLLNEKTDPKKFDFASQLQYGMAYSLFDSEDKQSLVAPYDEMRGLDAVVCTYLGEKDSIDINVKYSFLSPEVGRFTDKYKNEILDIYAPYTTKETFGLQGTKVQGVASDLPWSDHFNLGDTRFEKVEVLYKRWESENFVLTPEIKEALTSTLGVYGKDQSFKISSQDEIKKKELGKERMERLLVVLTCTRKQKKYKAVLM
jgi:hypothetical protein